MPDRTAEVRALVDTLAAADAKLGPTRLVCIDGPAGSGKTTLALAVDAAATLGGHRVATLHMDDFYEGWSGLEPGFESRLEARMLSQVLHPLAQGRPARWQRYDWHRGRFVEWTDLGPPDLLVLEGCGSGARAYTPHRSLLVWVEAPPVVRLRRAAERDGAQVLPRWRQWMTSEEAHFERNDTRTAADVRGSA